MIRFEGVRVTYTDAPSPVLDGVDLHVPDGELCVVVGRTGSGKSTLLAATNGLVPHFTGGELAGRVLVAGRDTRTHPPRELADVVGFVGQDPVAGFVTDRVEDELAYAMESIGLAPPVMRRRVEETLDLLGLAELRDRALATLSGGQQQRVAIGSALTAHPRILVLDEPTSALDPGAAEEVLAALHRLVHDLGITVLMAEHKLERVVQFADRVVWLPGGGRPPVVGEPGDVLAATPVAPPVVRLGAVAGWDRPAISVRDARRRAATLRERLAPLDPTHYPPGRGGDAHQGGVVLSARGVVVRYPGRVAVNGVDLAVRAGERVALMGRNGSGKSSLLWALQGTGARHGGDVRVCGKDPAALKPGPRRAVVGLVPQQPTDLLYHETVAQECAQADTDAHTQLTAAAPSTHVSRSQFRRTECDIGPLGADECHIRSTGAPGEPANVGGRRTGGHGGVGAGATAALLERIVPGIAADAHPRDLSEGQRLAVALAVTLAVRPPVLLLDEPTRGLDQPAKVALAAVLRGLADAGTAVVLATHDVEFVAEYAGRVVLLADGEVIADGPVADVITSSPVFAPQVAKVLAPQRWLTVAQVERALKEQAPDERPPGESR